MKYILLPKPDTIHQLPFYFAVEEYVARHYTDDDYFMGWRVNPTVMLGRNQLIDNEVNTDYCKEHKINIFRRKVVEDVSMPTRVAYSSLIFHVPSMPMKPLLLICNEWQTY